MSSYTVLTNYAIKDALAHNDPNKLVLGSDLTAEFNAISSAVNSKADAGSAGFGTAAQIDYTTPAGLVAATVQAAVDEVWLDLQQWMQRENRVLTGAFKVDGITLTALTTLTTSSLSPATDLKGSFIYNIDTSPSGSADRQAAIYGTQVSESVYVSTAGNANAGGFLMFARVMILTARTGMRVLMGMTNFAGGIMTQTQDPSAQTNFMGFAKDVADTNLQFMYNDASGVATKVDLGFTPASVQGSVLDILIYVPAGGASCKYFVKNRDAGTTLASGTISTNTNFPAASAALLPCYLVNTGNQTSNVVVGYSRVLLWTPF